MHMDRGTSVKQMVPVLTGGRGPPRDVFSYSVAKLEVVEGADSQGRASGTMLIRLGRQRFCKPDDTRFFMMAV